MNHPCNKEDKIDMMYDMIIEVKQDIKTLVALKWKIVLAILSLAIGSNIVSKLL